MYKELFAVGAGLQVAALREPSKGFFSIEKFSHQSVEKSG
jgi:hypothetical protein